jgi:hypothetical protein
VAWMHLVNDKSKKANKTWLVSVAADATKVAGKVNFYEPYDVWVGGVHPNLIVKSSTFDADNFVATPTAK